MTYMQLFNCRAFVPHLKTMRFRSGTIVFELQKFLKKFDETLAPFQETVSALIATYGDGDGAINPGHKNWEKFSQELEGPGSEEITWDVKPFLSIEDYVDAVEKSSSDSDGGVSVLELETMLLLGILREGEDVDEPEPDS